VHGFARASGRILSASPLLLGYAWALWDHDRQAWHDKMARTHVVRATPAFSYRTSDLTTGADPFAPKLATADRGVWLWAGVGAVVVVAMLGASVAAPAFDPEALSAGYHLPGEFRAAHPIPADDELAESPAAAPIIPDPCPGEGRRVCFVAIGHPPTTPLDDLVAYYETTYELPVTQLPPLALRGAERYEGEIINREREQLDVSGLFALMRRTYPGLWSDPQVTLVGVTWHDIYHSRKTRLRYLLGQFDANPGRFAVVSSARMDNAAWGFEPSDDLLNSRLRKMVSRELGFLHYGLRESDDPTSVMYWTIDSVSALDEMNERLPLEELAARPPGLITGIKVWRGSGRRVTGVFEVERGAWEVCTYLQGRADGAEIGLRTSVYTESSYFVGSDSGYGVKGDVGCFTFTTEPGRFFLSILTPTGSRWEVTVQKRDPSRAESTDELPPWNSAPTAIGPDPSAEPGTVAFSSGRGDITQLFAVPSSTWEACWELFASVPEYDETPDRSWLTITALFEDEPGEVGEWRINNVGPGDSGCVEVSWRQPGRYRLRALSAARGVGWRITIPGASIE
jgi:predicted Zn-dependent protease